MSASPLYLAIDAGNTRIKFGVFEAATQRPLPNCWSHGSVMCGQPLMPHLAAIVPEGAPGRAIISGSNPAEIARVMKEWPLAWPLSLLEDRTQLPLAINVDAPDRVGWDRLLNAVAAQRLRRPDQAAIIVDSGTATTVDFVDATGAFCGGAILPGIGMSARALHHYTALLPLIPAPEVTSTMPETIGQNTVDAMRSGLYWGHVGAVRELVGRMLSDAPSALVIVTGGAGGAVIPHLDPVEVAPHLPLQGLVLAMSGLSSDGRA